MRGREGRKWKEEGSDKEEVKTDLHYCQVVFLKRKRNESRGEREDGKKSRTERERY